MGSSVDKQFSKGETQARFLSEGILTLPCIAFNLINPKEGAAEWFWWTILAFLGKT